MPQIHRAPSNPDSILCHASAIYKTASATNRPRALRSVLRRWVLQSERVTRKSSIFLVCAFFVGLFFFLFSLFFITPRLLTSLSLSLSLSFFLSFSLSLSLFLSLSLSLSHTHTHAHHTAHTAQALTHSRIYLTSLNT
jgi:hypothetical protein